MGRLSEKHIVIAACLLTVCVLLSAGYLMFQRQQVMPDVRTTTLDVATMPVVGKVMSTRGVVEVQKYNVKNLVWGKIQPGTVLSAGDRVRTSSNSSLVIHLINGTDLVIQSNITTVMPNIPPSERESPRTRGTIQEGHGYVTRDPS